MLGTVAEIHIEHNQIVRNTVPRGEPYRLSDAEVRDMMKDANVFASRGKLLGQLTGSIIAPVIDDHDFPAILVLEVSHISTNALQIHLDDRSFVEGRQQQGNERFIHARLCPRLRKYWGLGVDLWRREVHRARY